MKHKASKKFKNVKCFGLKRKENGGKFSVSCGQENNTKKFFVYTHRARTKAYDSISNIPLSRIKFIESTG